MKRRNFLKMSSTAALIPAASLLSLAAVKKHPTLKYYLRVMLQTKMRAANLLETLHKEYHLK